MYPRLVANQYLPCSSRAPLWPSSTLLVIASQFLSDCRICPPATATMDMKDATVERPPVNGSNGPQLCPLATAARATHRQLWLTPCLWIARRCNLQGLQPFPCLKRDSQQPQDKPESVEAALFTRMPAMLSSAGVTVLHSACNGFLPGPPWSRHAFTFTCHILLAEPQCAV